MINKLNSSIKARSTTTFLSNTPCNTVTAIVWTKHATSDFSKGINRGKSQYKELKEESWDDWKYYTMATVVAHGCEPVTELTYVPKDQGNLRFSRNYKSLCYWDSVYYHGTTFCTLAREHWNCPSWIKIIPKEIHQGRKLENLMPLITSVRLNLSQMVWIIFNAIFGSDQVTFRKLHEESYVVKCSPRTQGICKCYKTGENIKLPNFPPKQGKLNAQCTVNHESQWIAQVNFGANSGITEKMSIWLQLKKQHINVTIINNHLPQDLLIVIAGGLCSLDKCEILVVMHQYTYSTG